MLLRIRGWAAYRAWQARQHPDIVFGGMVFVLSLFGGVFAVMEPIEPGFFHAANMAVVMWGLTLLVRSGREHSVLVAAFPDWESIHVEPAGSHLVRGPKEGEAAVVWPAVDRVLWRSTNTVKRGEPFKLDAQARAIAIPALRHHRGDAAIRFNDPKVRLSTTLTPDILGADEPIDIQRTDYFSSLVTNELTGREMVRRTQCIDVAYDGISFFLSGSRLLRHEVSRTSDHIGISVHGITCDGVLVSTLQAARSAQDPGRYAPAGSGSMDWSDAAGSNGDRLIDIVAAAMKRELAAECGLPDDVVTTPMVAGYARLLHRGGKPEFFGISRIKARYSELSVSRDERPFVDSHRSHPVRLETAETFIDSLDEITQQFQNRHTLQWTLTNEALGRHATTGLLDRFLQSNVAT